MTSFFWQVALPCAPHETYTYAEPEHLPPDTWRPGLRVLVPVGNSTRLGVLCARLDQRPADLPGDVRVRGLLWPVEREPLLTEDYMALAANLAARQMEPLGRVLENLLPSGLRAVGFSFRVYDAAFPARLTPAALRAQTPEGLAALAALWAEGRMQVAVSKRHDKAQEFCSLTADPPWAVRPTAKRQMEICEYLWDNGPTPRPALMAELGQGAAQSLNRLIASGLVAVGPAPEFAPQDCPPDGCEGQACLLPEDGAGEGGGDFAPTPEQARALGTLEAAQASDAPRPHLVYGVTGSGKTLVYLRLAEQALDAGRSVLLLAPEVALACALHRAAQARFPGREVLLYHGYQPPARREEAFKAVAANGGARLVVGTRSALFLPLRGLGLVVLDEEHDASFKQEERLPYQAKEVAHFLARRAGALLVLGSATPDVKTFQAAQAGSVGRVDMPSRVSGNGLPPVELVDLRTEPPEDGPLAPSALAALKDTVARGEQAVILLNRRGYAPVMYCLDCGKVARCIHCDVGLTYHKARERLVCHYCGASEPFPRICECGGANFLPMGEGTENVEETLSRILPPDAGVLRLDRDSTRRAGRMDEILGDFAAGKAQVLVGTQMLSKGHHFPDVTLALVVDGDLGLNVPDYRAAERMFQLMVQVSGRAGRGDRPGRVLIQTRNPDHYCWRFVLAADYEGFFAEEVAKRRRYSYPPFTHLALLRLSYPAEREQGREVIMGLASVLAKLGAEQGVRVLGPAPSPIAQIRGRMRFQCLLKGDDWLKIRSLYAEARRRLPAKLGIRVSLDQDPVNML